MTFGLHPPGQSQWTHTQSFTACFFISAVNWIIVQQMFTLSSPSRGEYMILPSLTWGLGMCLALIIDSGQKKESTSPG